MTILELRALLRRNVLDLREDESIAVEPIWVLWVEGHEFVEEDVGSRCHAHRGTRVTGVGFEGGIDLLELEDTSWRSWEGTGQCRVKGWEFDDLWWAGIIPQALEWC